MVTLNCNHADAGPVIITTPEPDGLITFLRRYRDEADFLAGDVLTCDDYAFSLSPRWHEVVHDLYQLSHPTFLVTAHPGFVDEVHFESERDARDRILRWRGGRLENLAEDEVRSIYAAYSVGIQHVSEILACAGVYVATCGHPVAEEVITGYPRRCADCGEAVRNR